MPYSFSHEWKDEQKRLTHLEYTYDPSTRELIEKIDIKEDAVCLEAGAGNGSIAVWLSERFPAGRVVATDTQIQFLKDKEGPNLEVREHNLVTDKLEENTYDFIHGRALLEHIPQREVALKNLYSALKPGGIIFIESHDMVTSFPTSDFGSQEFSKATKAAVGAMESNGFVSYYGRILGQKMREIGLHDIEIEGRAYEVAHDKPMSTVWTLLFEQLRERMISINLITDEEINHAQEIVNHPSFFGISPLFISGRGTKPA